MPVFAVRTLATLALGLAGSALWLWMHWPLPWMLGPVLVTAVATVGGAPTRVWSPLVSLGQGVIGTALGLAFTPQVALLVASHWLTVLLAIAWTLFVGGIYGWWLYRMHGALLGVGGRAAKATCWYSAAVGGAAEMTLLAEREGGRGDLAAAAHTMRVLTVSMVVPVALVLSGAHGSDLTGMATRPVEPVGLVMLFGAAVVGVGVLQRLGQSNPWFLGPLVVSIGLSLARVELSGIPTLLSNAAQLVIGVSLGARFHSEFMRTAPRWMASAFIGTLALILACSGFAWMLAWVSGLQTATLILGLAPGGVAEMSITAKVLQLGAPLVTVFHVCRVLVVLFLLGPLFNLLSERWESRD